MIPCRNCKVYYNCEYVKRDTVVAEGCEAFVPAGAEDNKYPHECPLGGINHGGDVNQNCKGCEYPEVAYYDRKTGECKPKEDKELG